MKNLIALLALTTALAATTGCGGPDESEETNPCAANEDDRLCDPVYVCREFRRAVDRNFLDEACEYNRSLFSADDLEKYAGPWCANWIGHGADGCRESCDPVVAAACLDAANSTTGCSGDHPRTCDVACPPVVCSD